MLASLTETFTLIEQQISIYFGIPLFIVGIIGDFLAIIVLLSLRTFRQNSCAFYLIIMQFFNFGQLFVGLLNRILMTGFNINVTLASNILCKLRPFFMQVCSLMSLACLCLATIDQYFATCSRPSWQRWNNLKLAYRLVIVFILISILHGIPYLIFVNIINLPLIGIVCNSYNSIFFQYHYYFVLPILFGFLPIIILTFFGCLAYYNVRHMNYRTVPLVRQELDKQLTVMVLLQIFLNIFGLLPYAIIQGILVIPQIISDPIMATYMSFFNSISSLLFYIYFAGSFYIYICASERFRRQLIYVIFKMHRNRWHRRNLNNNQVVPQG